MKSIRLFPDINPKLSCIIDMEVNDEDIFFLEIITTKKTYKRAHTLSSLRAEFLLLKQDMDCKVLLKWVKGDSRNVIRYE